MLLKNVTIVLVQLVGSDTSAGHTVCIVKKSDLCYILDSNEEYAMRLTARNLAFATASRHCIGWQAVLLFTAKEPLRNSDTRLKCCPIDLFKVYPCRVSAHAFSLLLLWELLGQTALDARFAACGVLP